MLLDSIFLESQSASQKYLVMQIFIEIEWGFYILKGFYQIVRRLEFGNRDIGNENLRSSTLDFFLPQKIFTT